MADTQQNNTSGTITQPLIDPTLIRLRLDTKDILQSIEVFLRGEKIEYTMDESGQIVTLKTKIGEAKANPKGIASILNWISLTINPHVVQGNFPSNGAGYSKEYEDFCYYFQVELGNYLMLNIYNFNIDESEYQGIIDSVMNIVRPFMTRLLDNKERESYFQTLKTQESSNTMSRGFSLFNRQ